MLAVVQSDQEFRIERVESCCENNGPHDRIKKRTEDDAQLPREQEQNAEEGDGKYLFGGHGCISVLRKLHESPAALTVEVRKVYGASANFANAKYKRDVHPAS